MARKVAPGWLLSLMVFNTVAAVGLFGDIARHVTLIGTLQDEDFLAGWHLVLYGGVFGVATVLGAYAYFHGPRAPWDDLKAAVAGMATLTAGGVADAVWHEAFGVEAAFEALVSPPHLLVFAGLVLLMIAPIGTVAAGPDTPVGLVGSLVIALSVTSLLIVVSLFTGYLTPLIGGSEFQAGAYQEPLVGTSYLDQDTARGLSVTLWFGAVLAGVVSVVRARCGLAFGTWTVAFGLLAIGPLVATGRVAFPVAAGLVVFGFAVDLSSLRGQPHPLALGASVAAMWAAMFALIRQRELLVWGVELWGGTIATGVLVGTAVGGSIRWLSHATVARDGGDPGLRG